MERKLAKQDERFFRLAHRRAENGQPAVRLWEFACRKCGNKESITPGSSSDEAIRRAMSRRGWDLGRRWNQHLCPVCNNAAKPPSQPLPAAPLIDQPEPKPFFADPADKQDQPFLVEAWETAGNNEQTEFVHWLATNVPQVVKTIALLNPPPKTNLRDFWETMPEIDRQRFLDRQRPPQTLQQHWKLASPAEAAEFATWIWNEIMVQNLSDYVSLTDMWTRAKEDQRQQLLGYLREAGLMTIIKQLPPTPPSNITIIKQLPPARPSGTAVLPPGSIRKTDFARELDITGATVSGYLQKGMPVRDDGLLDADVVRAWVKNNIGVRKRSVYLSAVPPPDISAAADLADDEAITTLRKSLFG